MQTTKTTLYHCAKLRRSVPVTAHRVGEWDRPRRCRAGCARQGLCAGQRLSEGRELPADGRRVGRLDGRPTSPSLWLGQGHGQSLRGQMPRLR